MSKRVKGDQAREVQRVEVITNKVMKKKIMKIHKINRLPSLKMNHSQLQTRTNLKFPEIRYSNNTLQKSSSSSSNNNSWRVTLELLRMINKYKIFKIKQINRKFKWRIII